MKPVAERIADADAAVTAAHEAVKRAVALLGDLCDLRGEPQRHAELALEDAEDALKSMGDCSRQISQAGDDLEE